MSNNEARQTVAAERRSIFRHAHVQRQFSTYDPDRRSRTRSQSKGSSGYVVRVISLYIVVVMDVFVCLESMCMRVQKVRLNAELHLEIAQTLTRQPAIYPVKYQQMYEFSKVAQTQIIRETLFTDHLLPSYVYLMIVDTANRVGAYGLK